jgi:hypothetical protein
MIAFTDEPLEGLVEVDHAKIQLRNADGSLNHSASGWVTVAAACETTSDNIRVAKLADDTPASI